MSDAPVQPTRLKIRGLAHGGDGVGEPIDGDGPVWFVPGTWTGDVVDATPEHEAARFVRGRLQQLVERSPDRVQPPCTIADRCGGCSWQHAAPGAQATTKRTIVAEQLRRVCEAQRVELVFEGSAQGYRRRARMHYEKADDGALRLGFRAPSSHDIVDQQTCPVLVPALDRGLQRLRALAEVLPAQGDVLALTDGTQVLLGLPGVRPGPDIEKAALAVLDEVVVGIEVRGARTRGSYGRRWLDLDGGGGLPPLRGGAFAFAQAQAEGARALVRHVATQARPDGLRVLELFAGSGNFTRALAKRASRVWASDTDRDAVEALRNLAQVAHLPINAKKQSAAGLLPKLAGAGQRYDVAVLDPPRAGLGTEAMRALCKVASERIVYVSCDPATLARDLAVATDHGFDVRTVGVFDLMPMTPQVEVVATLARPGEGVKDILDALAAGKVAPVYLLYGNEPGPIRAIVDAIRKAALEPGFEAFNHERFAGREVESIGPVLEACQQLPVMASRRMVELDDPEVVGKSRGSDAAKVAKDNQDALIAYVGSPNPTSTLVLVSSGIDGRSRLVTAVKKAGVVAKFEHLKRDRDAVDFVREQADILGLRIDGKAANLLVELVGTGQSELLHALDRASLHAGEGKPVTTDNVDAVVAHTRDAVIFELTDAVGMGQRDRALQVLARMFTENPTGEIGQANAALAMLIRQLRLVFIAKEAGGNPGAIQAAAGVPPFVAKKLASQSRGFDEERLRRAYAGLARLDRDLKGGSYAAARGPYMALQRWIIDVCGGLPGAAPRV